MTLWITLAVNSIALGGLLFLLSAGFSLIFGLMRIPNLTHGSFFMLGAYFGVFFLGIGLNFWLAALASGLLMAGIGALVEAAPRFGSHGLARSAARSALTAWERSRVPFVDMLSASALTKVTLPAAPANAGLPS